MENNAQDKKVISVRIRRKPEPKVEPNILFAPSRTFRKFVTEFVASWIRGDIIIHFPTAAELAKKTPLSIAFPTDPSVNAELKIKEHYVDLLSVLAGIKPSSARSKRKQFQKCSRCCLCSVPQTGLKAKSFQMT